MEAELFRCPDSLLLWLPGESFFSLCSRHHQLWGHAIADRSAKMLFGHRRRGTHHDLPSGLDEFERRTEQRLGTAEMIARDKTLLRFYRPFLEGPTVSAAVSEMRGASVAHLKFSLGLLTSRFRANHPLKACPECMRTDVAAEGWAYWHLEHQFPGVWVCGVHDCLLRSATVKATGVERFQWHSPDESRLTPIPEAAFFQSAEALTRLGELVRRLVNHPKQDGWLNVSHSWWARCNRSGDRVALVRRRRW